MAALFHYVFLSFLLSSFFICDSIREGSPAQQSQGACSFQGYNGSGLILQHRYGPCSVLGGQKPTRLELLSRDQQRVSWIQTRVHNSHTWVQPEDTTLPARWGAPLGTPNYIVTLGFGTPKRAMTLDFDTGSDVTWIQCKPCTGSCYKQQEPIFDPTQSSSYANLPCNSAECTQLSGGRCSSSTCQYAVQYVDGSITIGSYAHETVTLTPSDVLPGFLFGCGHDNRGLLSGTAGLLGLGRGTQSILTQTVRKYNGVFSYCLPSSEKLTGYLTFGAKNVPKGVRYTPLVSNPDEPTLYTVDLTGISVNGKKLLVAPSTFKTGGTIFDSGAVLTRLPAAAYAALASAVGKAMKSAAKNYDGLECYVLTKKLVVPKITLHMKGVDMELHEDGVLYKFDKRLGCLAFLPLGSENETAIIGNAQQRTFRMVYDIPNRRIGFAAGGCT